MTDFTGKYIWIIGASSGIGRSLAIRLAEKGAILALSSRRKEKLEELNSILGGKHFICSFDVSDSKMVNETAKAVKENFPKIDSVIFMAALYVPSGASSMAPQMVYEIVNANLSGAIYLSNAIVPILESQQKGQLVLCASVAGYRGMPGGQPYSATKAGLINFAESLRLETSEKIDIKIINSGFVKTRITDKNSFSMPMIIDSERAAEEIIKGLNKNIFEITFPKSFTIWVKLLRIIPTKLYFWFARKYLKPNEMT